MVATASVPTALFGLAFDGDIIQNFYEEMYLVGTGLIITGIVIWFSKNYNNNLSFSNLSFSKTFCVGVVQGLSILPGISRSGTTIAFLRMFGLEPITAARFSFLIFIPAIIGATFLKLNEAGDTLEEVGLVSILLGFSFSVISSFVSIKFLLAVINNQKFHYFTPYCLMIGTFLIFESYFLTPKLVGEAIKLNPIWIIFALMTGAYLSGFVGVLISLPIAAIIGVVVRHYFTKLF